MQTTGRKFWERGTPQLVPACATRSPTHTRSPSPRQRTTAHRRRLDARKLWAHSLFLLGSSDDDGTVDDEAEAVHNRPEPLLSEQPTQDPSRPSQRSEPKSNVERKSAASDLKQNPSIGSTDTRKGACFDFFVVSFGSNPSARGVGYPPGRVQPPPARPPSSLRPLRPLAPPAPTPLQAVGPLEGRNGEGAPDPVRSYPSSPFHAAALSGACLLHFYYCLGSTLLLRPA